MTDFFISYTHKDKDWAEWVGYALEAKGFEIAIQAWDFRPGSNFVLEMQCAAAAAKRTILIISPDFLKSNFAAPEWAAAFANDPQGLDRRLVPVMVRDCEPQGLLKAVVQIRLVGLNEDAARDELLRGVDQKRAKPSSPPPFPGGTTIKPPMSFPGYSSPEPPEDVPGSGPAEPPKDVLGSGSSVKPGKKGLFAVIALVSAGIAGAAAVAFTATIQSSGGIPNLLGYDSSWMGGGHNQEEQCGPLRAKYAAENPNFNITVQSWQDSDKDMLGHVTYRFHCRYVATRK